MTNYNSKKKLGSTKNDGSVNYTGKGSVTDEPSTEPAEEEKKEVQEPVEEEKEIQK